MTGSPDHPRFRALEIGPGGVPADQVRPVENGDVAGGTPAGAWPPVDRNSTIRATYPQLTPEPRADGPSAVFGSFDDEADDQPSRRAVFGWFALALVVGVLVAVSLWSGNSDPTTDSAGIRQGDCLAASAGRVGRPGRLLVAGRRVRRCLPV